MFLHVFTNRFKCLIRDRQSMFWTFLYPLVIATLFGLAFSNLSSTDSFKQIPVGVVNNAEYQRNTAFQSALVSVSDKENQTDGEALFNVTLSSREQAEESLKENKIVGYIDFNNGAHVVVKDSGLNQTILKEFMDSYLQAESAYKTIVAANPDAAQNFRFNPGSASHLTDVPPAKSSSNNTLTAFYALIAMAALFGGFWGKKEIADIQADISPQAARLNLGPVHKLKILGYSFLASVAVQFISLLVLVAYLMLVIKVDFGGQLGFVLLTCLAGSFAGVSLGALISVLVKKSESMKISVLIAVSLTMSFLAGMMMISVKYTVTHAVPVLAYINPANLIADALYSLYYYSSHARFFLNIGLLMGISVVFYLVVYFVARRQKYANI